MNAANTKIPQAHSHTLLNMSRSFLFRKPLPLSFKRFINAFLPRFAGKAYRSGYFALPWIQALGFPVVMDP
jgi:hypothetical protein